MAAPLLARAGMPRARLPTARAAMRSALFSSAPSRKRAALDARGAPLKPNAPRTPASPAFSASPALAAAPAAPAAAPARPNASARKRPLPFRASNAPREPPPAPRRPTSFTSLGLNAVVATAVEKGFGFLAPTEAQAVAIPALLKGPSACVTAETGTGKTLAVLLPAVQRIMALEAKLGRSLGGPRVLYLAPTRELVLQTERVASRLTHECRFSSRAAVELTDPGFKPATPIDFVAGLPLAVLALMRRRRFSAANLEEIILDEADVLLADSSGPMPGFLDEVRELLAQVPPTVSLVALGATAATKPSAKALGVLRSLRPDAVMLRTEAAGSLPRKLKFATVRCGSHDRMPTLERVMRRSLVGSARKIFVFCNSAQSADATAHFLRDVFPDDADVVVFHRGVDPPMRRRVARLVLGGGARLLAEEEEEGAEDEEPLSPAGAAELGPQRDAGASSSGAQGRDAKKLVVVCTDILARGLDVPDMDDVIMFESPPSVVDFVHRAGRTGRAGRPGRVTLLIGPGEAPFERTVARAVAASRAGSELKFDGKTPREYEKAVRAKWRAAKEASEALDRRRAARSATRAAPSPRAAAPTHGKAALRAKAIRSASREAA